MLLFRTDTRLNVYLLCTLPLLWLSIAQSQIIIDSFDQGPFSLTSETHGVEGSQTASDTDIAGGTRRVVMQQETNPFLSRSTLSLSIGDGFLSYNRQQNAFIELSYGSFIPFTPPPMNLNATADGADRFRLEISAAPGPINVYVGARDNSFFQHEATVLITGNGSGTYDVPFAAFAGVEFDKLGGVRIFFPNGVDPVNGPGIYRFDMFQTAVPEPATWGFLTGAGLLVLGFLNRRLRHCAEVRKRAATSAANIRTTGRIHPPTCRAI